jgi:HK97 family phage portal protein
MPLWERVRALFAARRTAPDRERSAERTIWLPRADLGGIRMTPDEALRLSAVWACVTTIAKALASCDWDVFSERANGDRESRRNLSAYTLLNTRPNPDSTAFAFKEAMYIQASVWSNFYAEIEFTRGGTPIALWPLAPERCRLEYDAGAPVVVVNNGLSGETVLAYDHVFHIHGPGIDAISGFDVVTLAARSLAHAAAAERFGQSFYHNNAQFGGLLAFDGKLSDEAREATRKAVNERHKGSANAFGLLVMDNAPKYEAFGVEPEKAQFIETRHLLIEEVCRWFGVPPHKVAHLLRSTFSNIEHQSIEFVRDALTPWAERARQEADWKLLRPWPGIRTRINLEWLAEGDAKSKAETDSILVQNGIESRNEVRRKRGLNGLGPAGDKLTVQVNMTTLEKIGADMPVPDNLQQAAALALFRMAMLRASRRRARVAEQAREAAGDSQAFAAALAADAAEHARYVGHLVGDAVKLLRRPFDTAAAQAVLARRLDEESALYAAAFGNAGPAFDQTVRAETIAAELAALIGKETV